MPELPEVEHVRRHLHEWLVGARVVAAVTGDRNVVRAAPRVFAKRLVGRKIVNVERRGKWLRVELDDGGKIFAHLGMTGDFSLGESDRFERARFEIERRGKRSIVRYVDPRRWGRIV